MCELFWILFTFGGLGASFFLYIRSLFRSKFFGDVKPYPALQPFDDYTKVNTVWDDIYFEGYVRIRIGRNRRYIQIRNGELKGDYSFARIVWRCMNPDCIIAPDEDIHHVDFDSLNDCYENLRLVTKVQHTLLHKKYEDSTRVPRGLPIFNSDLKDQIENLKRALP